MSGQLIGAAVRLVWRASCVISGLSVAVAIAAGCVGLAVLSVRWAAGFLS